jgi:hypothetical protein
MGGRHYEYKSALHLEDLINKNFPDGIMIRVPHQIMTATTLKSSSRSNLITIGSDSPINQIDQEALPAGVPIPL